MREISLTNTDRVFIVDGDNYEWLSRRKWRASKESYVVTGKGDRVMVHRLIMQASKEECVDHINGNTLDNRRCNLRIANRSQNGQNRHRQKNNTSGYRGVIRKNRKWLAAIRHNYRSIYLGVHVNKIDAALAYNRKAKELFGEHAWQNPIDERDAKESGNGNHE